MSSGSDLHASDDRGDEVDRVRGDGTHSIPRWWRAAWLVIFLAAATIRLVRLSWQPLWWDEGYSVYFATEPLARMVWLTSQDIHPPLYYALLHLWLNLAGSSGPEVARLFSALIGIATLPALTWLTVSLFPRQRWLALIATALLAVNPLHIYYSQEIRMYGLALLLSLLATTLLWRIQQRLAQGDKPYLLASGYLLSAALALLTLYYIGFLLLAHQLWTFAINRNHWRRQLWYWVAAILILLMQLPWWLYAFPNLFHYIGDKVLADQDSALPLWSYLWRHWLAFFSGHLMATPSWLEISRQSTVGLIACALAIAAWRTKWTEVRTQALALVVLILIPFVVGFAVNLAFPFFPEGGERLLLQILPYLLVLVAMLIIQVATTYRRLAIIPLLLAFIAAAIGNFVFFTTPRYGDHDYRPIIAAITTNSRPQDHILALFPWQVGYWRAYSPRTVDGSYLPPQPPPVDQTILRWDQRFAAQLDADLQQGTLWFPMPLSFGSTLPPAIESYLQANARSLENDWYSPATRLTAWMKRGEPVLLHPINATFPDQITLVSGGITPATVASANVPVAVDLCWSPPSERDDLRTTLRLLDASGYTWAQRDLTPLAAYANSDAANPCLEPIAINIPAGLPPATYQIAVGIGLTHTDQLSIATAASNPLIPVGVLTVTTPSESLSPQRLPIEYRLDNPTNDGGLHLLGYTGPGAGEGLMAGDEVALTLFLQNTATPAPARDLYLSLLDRNGSGVAGWQEWPVPDYPTSAWAAGALAQVPARFYLPPTLAEGDYTLIAGFVDPVTGNKSAPATLNRLHIIRRPASFSEPPIANPLTPAPQFGTHALLVGYDDSQVGETLQVNLTWRVLQPLLPPHHIFVHLFDATGQRIAQSDGDPITASGPAPSGSWLPDEYMTTLHTLTIPSGARPPFTLQTGLYLPATGKRLPVTQNGAAIGDSVTLTPTTSSSTTSP